MTRIQKFVENLRKTFLKQLNMNLKMHLNRCHIATPELSFHPMDEDQVAMLTNSWILRMQASLKDALLMTFDSITKERIDPRSAKDVNENRSIHFYILDGQHTISAQKKIVGNPIYSSVHSKFQTFNTKDLACFQNHFRKSY